MKKGLRGASVGLFAAMLFIEKCKANALEIAQIYGATTYLKGVQIARNFFLYQIGILTCVVFLTFGVILMQVAVILYLPVESSVRAMAVFALGAVDCAAAGLFLRQLTSSDRWLHQASKYNAWLQDRPEVK